MSEGHTSIIFASFFMTAMNAITPSNLNSSWSNRQSKVCSFLDRNDFQRSSTSDRTLMSSKKFKKFMLLGKILRNSAKNLGWNSITTFLFFFKMSHFLTNRKKLSKNSLQCMSLYFSVIWVATLCLSSMSFPGARWVCQTGWNTMVWIWQLHSSKIFP